MGIDAIKTPFVAVVASLMLTISASADSDTAVEGGTPPTLPVQAEGPPDLPQPEGPPDLPTISYYIGVNGEKVGPLDQDGLNARIASGDLKADTLVWTKGMEGWEKAATRDDLKGLLAPKTALNKVPSPDVFDAKTFLVGKWTTNGTTTIPDLGEARVEGEETFGADGTYSATTKVIVDNPPTSLRQAGLTGALILDVEIKGRYKVTSQAGKNFSVEAAVNVTMTDRNGLGLRSSEQATETINYLSLDKDSFKDVDEGIVARRAASSASTAPLKAPQTDIAGVWRCEQGASPLRKTNLPPIHVKFDIELFPNGTMRAIGVANEINQFQAQGKWVVEGGRFATQGQMNDALGSSPFVFTSLVTSNTTMNERSTDQNNLNASSCQKTS